MTQPQTLKTSTFDKNQGVKLNSVLKSPPNLNIFSLGHILPDSYKTYSHVSNMKSHNSLFPENCCDGAVHGADTQATEIFFSLKNNYS